jgi:hypothetical protein
VQELDASELLAVGEWVEDGARRAAEGAYPLVKEHALALQRRWQENARATAGRHGKHYPRSITAEQITTDPGAVVWEVGPDRTRKQGSMGAGFEYGGPHQPPHLDGARATTATEPEFNAAIEELNRGLL